MTTTINHNKGRVSKDTPHCLYTTAADKTAAHVIILHLQEQPLPRHAPPE